MLRLIAFCIVSISCSHLCGQGFNHVWLHGSELTFDTNTTAPKARILFNSNSADTLGETRKMPFSGTQANVCDVNGNFLFASNGCWLMDATGDTMQNGAKLNPGTWYNGYCTNTTGMPMSGANLIIPYPGDSNRFVLFHHIGSTTSTVPNLAAPEIFYTVVDMAKKWWLRCC
ncbi:MAG: hypothetical protein IPJ79_18845 [Bacteroidetes bacterium]|nr:hypothetical protein [Bacteroidota bacterium]